MVLYVNAHLISGLYCKYKFDVLKWVAVNPGVIIYINFVEYIMLMIIGLSSVEDFGRFLPYIGMVASLVV